MHRLIVLAFALILVACSAASKPDAPVVEAPEPIDTPMVRAISLPATPVSRAAPVSHAPQQASDTPSVGDELLVKWGGSFWLARVLARLDSRRAVIHYNGWGEEHDEIVSRDRLAIAVSAPDRRYRSGDRLYVEWRGSYWPAVVTSVAGDRVGIRYEGYGSEWDEVVGPERIKHLSPLADPAPHNRSPGQLDVVFGVGDPVRVEWQGSWWDASVQRVVSQQRYAIHYDGWGNEWDEVVGPQRIRRR